MSVEIQETYQQQIEEWRKRREDALRSPEGWLSLVGLFLLDDGDYTLGSSDSNRIQLPSSAPATLGVLSYRDGKATLQVEADTPVTVDGVPTWSVEMVDNAGGRQPTVVKIATVSFNLHRFGDEVALRVRDSSSPTIAQFLGCEWYEVKPEYRVIGKLKRHTAPTSVEVKTSVATVAHYQSIGEVEFELFGQRLSLLAAEGGKAGELFIILRDSTAGRETYGAGRYLYVPVDDDGNVDLDFNKAYNPPCAFTPYATCSLPPTQNVLSVPIEAGERYSMHH